MSPFDYVNTINLNKNDLSETPEFSENYNPFITNRALSYFVDTILIANEINRRPQMDAVLQYKYLLNIVKRGKRFSKWHKPINNKIINMLVDMYKISYSKASEIADVLSEEQINDIKNVYNMRGEIENSSDKKSKRKSSK